MMYCALSMCVHRHGRQRSLHARRIRQGRKLLLLGLQHALNQILIAAQLGPVIATYTPVQVTGGRIAKCPAQVEHPKVIHRLKS